MIITHGEKKLHICSKSQINKTIIQILIQMELSTFTNASQKLIQIQVKTLTLTTNANANGVGYSVIRERGGAESEQANTKTRKTIK